MAAPALWLALTVALTATLPATQTVTVAAGPPPHELYIKAGLLIDGTSGAPRRDMANLYDNITFVDKLIGQILKDLDDDGLADNTVVFFWGDHGRGLPRSKRWAKCWPSRQMSSSTHSERALITVAPTPCSPPAVLYAPSANLPPE